MFYVFISKIDMVQFIFLIAKHRNNFIIIMSSLNFACGCFIYDMVGLFAMSVDCLWYSGGGGGTDSDVHAYMTPVRSASRSLQISYNAYMGRGASTDV